MEHELNDEKIPVMQLMDKCAVRGASIHGVSRLLLTWWPAFAASDFSLRLCVLRGRDGGVGEFHQSGIEVIDLDRRRLDPRTIFDLIGIIRRDGIRILHCHGYGATTFGRIAAKTCGIPAIVHEHMIDDQLPFYQKFADFFLSPLTAKGLAVSKAVAEFMISSRYIDLSKMEVVYNAIPQSSYRRLTADEKADVAKRINVSLDRPLVGIVGRLDPVKGHMCFLDAAVRVLTELPQAMFAIVGDGDLSEELQLKARKLGIDRNLVFLGYRKDVLDVMSLFDVYVNCSIAEGLGIANIEAMALGKAIVATNVGGIPELIEDGLTGILVPPEDPSSVANAIIRFLADADLRETLGNNALVQCQERFTISGAAIRIENIYRDLIANR